MRFDVLIVGGGLAGLALACALRASRLKIALVENHPPAPANGGQSGWDSGWDSRIYAISPANADFLREIGAWKHFDARRITAIHAMQIVGDGGAQLEFSAYEAGVGELGWTLESSLMAAELWQSVKRQSNLTLFCPAAPRTLAIGADAAQLTLADGQILSASLLVGADGRDSWVREHGGLEASNIPYGEMGVVANFACARAHRATARQWFRDDGVLAWLPLAGDETQEPGQERRRHRISMVWSTPDAHARELLALPPEALAERVAAAGGRALGDFELITPAAAFPLSLLRVPRTVAPRLALIGDAAHGVHPLSGHGINLGYQDARVLAELLAAAPEWQDVGSLRLLARYQRARREETLLVQYTTDTLRWLFREKLPGLKSLRNVGMNLSDRLPVVKNLLIRYAIGAF